MPMGSFTGSSALLTEKLLGEAFETIKFVKDNFSAIEDVAAALGDLETSLQTTILAMFSDSDGSSMIGHKFGLADPRLLRTKLYDTLSINDFAKASHDSWADTAADAETYFATVGGGTLLYPDESYEFGKTVFIGSNVTHTGLGNRRTQITFDGPNPASFSGSYLNPVWGNIRSAAFAIAGRAPDDLTLANYAAGHTGDYYTSLLRAFEDDSVIMPGATSVDAASVGLTSDLVAGGWLVLERGWCGWHSAIHEMAQIKALASGQITFTRPLEYEYRNADDDALNDFFANIAYNGSSAPGVDQETYEDWPQCGWRRINPIVGGCLNNLRVRNVNVFEGYGNIAIAVVRAVNSLITNVQVGGGGVWNIDSQGTRMDELLLERESTSYQQTDLLPGNGSNRTKITGLDQRTGNLDIEEGALFTSVQGFTAGHIFVNHFNQFTDLDMKVSHDTTYALRVVNSAFTTFKGSLTSQQGAVQYGGENFFDAFPAADVTHLRAAGHYVDGMNLNILPGSFVWSTANNSLDFYLDQMIRADGVIVGGTAGNVYSVPDTGEGRVIGTVIRAYDGAKVGCPLISGTPDIFPVSVDLKLSDGTHLWEVSNWNLKTAASAADADTVTINNNTTEGGIQAGDMVRCVIENTDTVTINAVEYAAGEARAFHFDTVESVNTGTGVVELVDGAPADWELMSGADSRYEFRRWKRLTNDAAVDASTNVTQLTSRATEVTIDTEAGSITLFSAAGSATPETFTVNNSNVVATDVIMLSQKSGADEYDLKVTRVAAGEFDITFNTTGGTTTEQPVFNFKIA